MEIIAEYGQLFIIIGCVVGFFMAWGIGANDVANAMGTSVGSRALTLGQAVMVVCIFVKESQPIQTIILKNIF